MAIVLMLEKEGDSVFRSGSSEELVVGLVVLHPVASAGIVAGQVQLKVELPFGEKLSEGQACKLVGQLFCLRGEHLLP